MILPRSILFVPGDRPDRFDKAAASGADRVLLDLEDAVLPAHKSSARDAVQAWLKSGRRVLVRINGCDSPWHDDDMHLLDELPGVGVMLKPAVPLATGSSNKPSSPRATHTITSATAASVTNSLRPFSR